MEGLIPYIYRAVVRQKSHQISHSSSRRNLLSPVAEQSSSGRSVGRHHVKQEGDCEGRFDNIAPQDILLNPTNIYPSRQSLLHRRAVSSCLFTSGDETSLGKQAIGKEKHPAKFRHANSFHYRP